MWADEHKKNVCRLNSGTHLKGPFTRSVFKDPIFGSKNWKQAFRRSDFKVPFCGENIGRSFVVCSHDSFSRTNKESSIWRQNDHAKFVGAFHLSRRVSDENKSRSKNGSCERALTASTQSLVGLSMLS